VSAVVDRLATEFAKKDAFPPWPADPFPGQEEYLRGWAIVFSSDKYKGALSDEVLDLAGLFKSSAAQVYERARQKVKLNRAQATGSNLGHARTMWRFLIAAFAWRLVRGEWPKVSEDVLSKEPIQVSAVLAAVTADCFVGLGLMDDKSR